MVFRTTNQLELLADEQARLGRSVAAEILAAAAEKVRNDTDLPKARRDGDVESLARGYSSRVLKGAMDAQRVRDKTTPTTPDGAQAARQASNAIGGKIGLQSTAREFEREGDTARAATLRNLAEEVSDAWKGGDEARAMSVLSSAETVTGHKFNGLRERWETKEQTLARKAQEEARARKAQEDEVRARKAQEEARARKAQEEALALKAQEALAHQKQELEKLALKAAQAQQQALEELSRIREEQESAAKFQAALRDVAPLDAKELNKLEKWRSSPSSRTSYLFEGSRWHGMWRTDYEVHSEKIMEITKRWPEGTFTQINGRWEMTVGQKDPQPSPSAVKEAEERARQIKYWEDYRDSNAAANAQYTAEAEKYDTASKYASAAQKGADLSMSIVSQYGGTAGKAFGAGYTFAKTTAGALAEGESVGSAITQGAKETILDLTTGAIQDKLQLGFKTPLQDVPAGQVITRLVEGGGKAAVTEGGTALANARLGDAIKYPITTGVEFIGRNLP